MMAGETLDGGRGVSFVFPHRPSRRLAQVAEEFEIARMRLMREMIAEERRARGCPESHLYLIEAEDPD